MRDFSRYLFAVIFSAMTALLATVLVPELTHSAGWIVHGLLTMFGVFFYADMLRFFFPDVYSLERD